jgi:hypothetical protein
MELIKVLKSIVLESRRIKLGSFTDDDGDIFNIIATIHSQLNVNKYSKSATRVDVDSISDVIIEFKDIFSKVSKSIEQDINKESIFVRDYTNRFDFILNPTYKNGKYQLFITTSMNHPEMLNVKRENVLIILKNDGDVIIKEQLELNNFTKIIRGDIIIYIK